MSGERLLEREAERAALGAAVAAAAAGAGRAVLVEGEAGLGKTTLLDAAATLARAQGLGTLVAHGGVLEQDVGWGVVLQLFEAPVLGEERLAGLLDGPARPAAPLFGGAAAGGEGLFAEGAGPGVTHALHRLVVALAGDGPLLVLIDDVHWADAASLRWLVYLARRVARLPVSVLAARRLGEPSPDDAALAELRAAAEVLAPAALSPTATRALAADAFGVVAEEPFVSACQAATGGNPFLLGELLRALAGAGVAPTASAEEQVRALRPAAVIADVTRRLARLSAEAGELARAVAVLDGEAELRHAVALAGLPVAAGEAAADELVHARILRAGRPLRFAHPILRAAVDTELPPARRAAAHRLAGALLDAEPRLADRAAAHLLACEPAGDAWVADRLRAAGERAMAHGAPAAAVRLLERARREPVDDAGLELALGRAHRLAGRHLPAIEHLRRALEGWPERAGREIVSELATALVFDARAEEGVAVLEHELAALDPDAPGRPRLLAAEFILRTTVDSLVADATERARRIGAGELGDGPGERALPAARALQRMRGAEQPASVAADAAERALADGALLSDHSPEAVLYVLVLSVLISAGRDEAAETWLWRAEAEARARGSELMLGMAELGLARLHLYRGELAEAVTVGTSALERALGSGYGRLITAGTLVGALVLTGERDAAETVIADHELDGDDLPPLAGATTLLRGRMALRSAQGRHAEARADAEDLLGRLTQRGFAAPGPLGEAGLVLAAAGQEERGRALAAEDLELAERWAAPGALGTARRVLGEVQARQPGGAGVIPLLEGAVAALERTPCRLELARALAVLGAARRRANARARGREDLRRALDLAERCGAAPLAAQAAVELRACGARPRRALLSGLASLTASERRVAELAASGLSNPEVARELVVSRSTVETHLRSVYRKLGVASRAELPAALGEPEAARR